MTVYAMTGAAVTAVAALVVVVYRTLTTDL
jgi:hypothetical protein